MMCNIPPPDSLLDGRLRLYQPKTGHRIGADAVLLAACTPPDASGQGVDVGAGVGAVGLAALLRAKNLSMTLVEIDARTNDFARKNIVENTLDQRARALEVDVLLASARRNAGLADAEASLVLTNPPYYQARSVRISPDSDKARAHVASVSVAQWMKAALALLAPEGRFAMIHRPEALGEILAAAEGRLGGLSIMAIAPNARKAANRILVGGVKGSRAPLRLLPTLALHQANGAFTREAEAVYRGEAGLDLFVR